MFSVADVVLLNKVDLLKFLDFDVERVKRELKEVNPFADFIEVSAREAYGLDRWFNYLRNLVSVNSI